MVIKDIYKNDTESYSKNYNQYPLANLITHKSKLALAKVLTKNDWDLGMLIKKQRKIENEKKK